MDAEPGSGTADQDDLELRCVNPLARVAGEDRASPLPAFAAPIRFMGASVSSSAISVNAPSTFCDASASLRAPPTPQALPGLPTITTDSDPSPNSRSPARLASAMVTA